MIPKRIDDATSINDLQVYACIKARNDKNWAMKCVDCKMCPVGKKAEELLEIETAPEKVPETVDPLMYNPIARIEEALKHDDPVKWLVEKGYYLHKKSASEGIRRYKQGKMSTKIKSTKPARIQIDAARQKVVDIFDSADTLEEVVLRYLEKQDKTKKIGSMFSKLYMWKKHYPDLDKKYPLLAQAARFLTGKEFDNLTVGEAIAKLSSAKEELDEDEVSVADFLDEQEESEPEVFVCGEETVTADGSVVKTEDLVKTATAKFAKPEEIGKESNRHTNQQILLTEFTRKRKELKEELAKVDDQIFELQAKKKDISANLESLDHAAFLFGMAATKPISKA